VSLAIATIPVFRRRAAIETSVSSRGKHALDIFTVEEDVVLWFLSLLPHRGDYVCYNGTCVSASVFKRSPGKVVYIFFKSAREFGAAKVFRQAT